jgi:hypothetical protein
VNDYEEGMRASFDAAKTWMAVSFAVSIFVAIPHGHTLGR